MPSFRFRKLASVVVVAGCLPVLMAPAEFSAMSPADSAALAELQLFGASYDYDTGYLEKLLRDSPPAYHAFMKGQGISEFRSALPLDAHFVARVATMLEEDCGPCTQLNLRMAVEAGVERSLLERLLKSPEELPPRLLDVRDHARAVVGATPLDADRAARLRAEYGDDGFAELAVVITGCRMWPALKRAMLENHRCVIGDLKY